MLFLQTLRSCCLVGSLAPEARAVALTPSKSSNQTQLTTCEVGFFPLPTYLVNQEHVRVSEIQSR